MFRKNNKHRQPPLLSTVSGLPAEQVKRLENSWAGVFYKEFFCRIDETAFAPLYSEQGSRPNVPVNVLLGLEVLKAGFGWSDEELYDHYLFDVQVRYALGIHQLGDDYFDLRTLYYFRERLHKYNTEHGINLIDLAFKDITDQQISALQVKTGIQRMDSTQVASNIASISRLRLLVEGIRRLIRVLSEADKQRLAELLEPFTKTDAKHYVYRVKGEEAVQEHLKKVGLVMAQMLETLAAQYAQQPAYQTLKRLYEENFREEGVPRSNSEIPSGSLQSVDDPEATYRVKGGKKYKGYVANITETADPDNEVQLITNVQVAPNNVDDAQLLSEAFPELKERTEVETLYTDGAYGSSEADQALEAAEVEIVQSAIRGAKPSSEKLHLWDFEITTNAENQPEEITCPGGQTVKIEKREPKKPGKEEFFVAYFPEERCEQCPLAAKCPAQHRKRDPRRRLRFTKQEMQVAQRRRRSQALKGKGKNPRAAVEATIRSIKHKFRGGKLPVRGLFRVTSMVTEAAMMVNIRRIERYFKKRAKHCSNEPQAVMTAV